MSEQQIIETAAKETELTPVTLAKLSGFLPDEIEFVKIFWEPTFNGSWLYITKEMVTDWLGYKNSKDTMKEFHKNLIKNYEFTIDY